MITHKYRTDDIEVLGGSLRVGVWDPIEIVEGATPPTVLAIHGITSSHLVWPFVVSQLPHTRVIAPDLRGRGESRAVAGPAGMRQHANDMVALLDHFGLATVPVIGHSMGGFVSVMLACLAPERVSHLMLVDGGIPFDVPPGLSPEQLAQSVLGPTVDRLSMRFDSIEHYLDFWRPHPAFVSDWSPEVADYFAYDLVPAGEQLRSATSLQITTEDIVDLNTGEDVPGARAALSEWQKPLLFITVPRGLRDEAPGMYSPKFLDRTLPKLPALRHVRLPDLNHYTVVMAERGAAALGELLRAELGSP